MHTKCPIKNYSELLIGRFVLQLFLIPENLLYFSPLSPPSPFLFTAFNQFLSRSCPLPFLEIPSPIHSQKCVHHQKEEEDQPQATPPSGTHVHVCTTLTCKDVMRWCALHVHECTYMYTDVKVMGIHVVSFSWIPGQCCYWANSQAAFWSNLDLNSWGI